MNKKNVRIEKIPSMIPYYISIGITLIASIILPMYKISSWMIMGGVGILSNIIIKKLNIFKDQEVEVEIPVEWASTEIENLVNLGNSQIATLKKLNVTIDTPSTHEDIETIIKTSELVIEHLVTSQKIDRDVRKYFRYYLDEIVKLVTHYDDFEEKDNQNISVSKEKIEATLANAKVAFQKFYNNLYEGKAMDISVDTKVFDNMLKQIG